MAMMKISASFPHGIDAPAMQNPALAVTATTKIWELFEDERDTGLCVD